MSGIGGKADIVRRYSPVATREGTQQLGVIAIEI
jgi:hypothetical protein